MYHARFRKAIACALLAIMLSLAVASTGAIASAAGDNGAPSMGTPPSGAPPTGTPPSGTSPMGAPPSGGGGANTMTYDYKGALTGVLTANGTSVTSNNDSCAASAADQNAALVQNAGTLTVTNDTITKTGDDTNGDNCNFYGLNSILLGVNEGSNAYISGSSLSSSSEGSNGIFATDNAAIYANNDTITTTAGNSRGLDATYGGKIVANLMKIATQGNHCAALATDRGGGDISVTNSTLSTAGSGSPLIYSTGNIEVDNVTGTSTGSQIAGMEGLNTIVINNSDLASTITNATASDPIADGVIIYQSTSGDAESTTGKTATFQAVNSSLKSAIESGAMFYFTNTRANVVLSNTALDFDSTKANLMTIQGNSSNNWGTAGKNGASVSFTGIGETLKGNIDVDTISSLSLYLLKNTVYTGATSIATNAVNTNASSAPITINLDDTSKWVVTTDSTVSNLNTASGSSIVDANGNPVTIVVNGSTVVSGTSPYKVTVTGKYSTTVTTDSSNEISTSDIDRTAFDKYYGTATTFGQNGTGNYETASTQTVAAEPHNKSNNNVFYGIIIAAIIIGSALGFGYQRRRSRT